MMAVQRAKLARLGLKEFTVQDRQRNYEVTNIGKRKDFSVIEENKEE
jgi:hypothetical protein